MSKINNLFPLILNTTTTILTLISKIDEKIKYLMDLYINLVNNNDKLDTITTDSFYFQIKLIKTQFENNKTIFIYINNQIYGDYYKLIKFIEKYVDSSFKSNDESEIKSIIKKFIPYKITDSSNNYTINSSKNIYINIVDTINALNKYLDNSKKLLNSTQRSLNTGIDIDNLLESIKSNNVCVEHKINLFINLLNGYTKYHMSYLNNLIKNLKHLYNDITNNIHFNTSTSKSSSKSNELYNKYINKNIDNDIIDINCNILDNSNYISKLSPYKIFIKFSNLFNFNWNFFLAFMLLNTLTIFTYRNLNNYNNY